LIPLYVVVLVWAILYGYEWVSTYFENQQKEAYQQAPINLKLKSKPQDVIYSEAYKTASGTDAVKYAYLTEEVPVAPGEAIDRRTPNSQTKVLDTKQEGTKKIETLNTRFFSKPQMYQENGKWRQIEYATTTSEVFSMSGAIPYIQRRELAEQLLPGTPVYATVSTYYPDPNVETSSVDGHSDCSATDGSDAGWGTCYPATSGTGADDSGIYLTAAVSHYRSGDLCPPYECYDYTYGISRGFMLFNTASLPDSSVISAATISLYVAGKDVTACGWLDLIPTTPASNTAIATADYDQVGTTLQATSLDVSAMSSGAYNAFTLNSTGIGNITLTGVSKFGIREQCDTDGTGPQQFGDGYVTVFSADQTGTSNDPKLDVTYTASSFSVGMWFPF
jgi:hypothetical protein